MNTRIQVEHPVTEEIHPFLDIVELMILQGIAQHRGGFLPEDSLLYKAGTTLPATHAIEARVYAENPAEGFRPSPGTLQCVDFSLSGSSPQWLRIDTWVCFLFFLCHLQIIYMY